MKNENDEKVIVMSRYECTFQCKKCEKKEKFYVGTLEEVGKREHNGWKTLDEMDVVESDNIICPECSK